MEKLTRELRQNYLRSLKYNIPKGSSWGPWQLKLWDQNKNLVSTNLDRVIMNYDLQYNKNGDPNLRPKYLYDSSNKRWINTKTKEYTPTTRKYFDKGFTGKTFTFGYYDYDDLLGKWVLYNSNGTKTDLELIKAKARNYLFLPEGKRGTMMELFRAQNWINGNSINPKDYWKAHNYYYTNVYNMSNDDVVDYFDEYGKNVVKAAEATAKTEMAIGAALGGSAMLPELAVSLNAGKLGTYLISEAPVEWLWGNAYDTTIKNFTTPETYNKLNLQGAVFGGILGLLGGKGSFLLSAPDLNTDVSNLAKSKNPEEFTKNLMHVVADWPGKLSKFTKGKWGILDDLVPWIGLADDTYSAVTDKDIVDTVINLIKSKN